MNSQAPPQRSPSLGPAEIVATPAADSSAGTFAVASPAPTRAPVPTPSLKPGEVITWIKFERPRFPIGEIVVSSFTFVGIAVLMAIFVGMFLGHLKSKRAGARGTDGTGTHGTGGLGLR